MTEEKLNEYKHVTQEFTNLKAQQTYNELQEKIYQIEKDAAFPKDQSTINAPQNQDQQKKIEKLEQDFQNMSESFDQVKTKLQEFKKTELQQNNDILQGFLVKLKQTE